MPVWTPSEGFEMNLQCKILHLEDSDDDSFLFQRVLARLNFSGVYRRVPSVDTAMEFLAGGGEYADRKQFPLPDVLVIDNSVPGAHTTRDLAAWLKNHADLSLTPMVMLTGAMSLADQQAWLERGISSVYFKGASIPELAVSVEAILQHCR